MPDLVCAGMALVDSIIRGFDPTPVSASGYRAVSASLSAGGAAVNEAVAAAKLGLETAVLCRLGDDPAGDLVERHLKSAGVDTGRIVRFGSTPVTTLFVAADGSRKSVTNEAHRQNFHPERDPSRFTDARALMLGSLFRAPFDDPAIVLSVLREARKAGQLVFADTKIPHFTPLTLADFGGALPLIHYITPNEDEARFFTGREDPEAMADVFLRAGAQAVIIKLGPKGCFFKNRAGSLRLPGHPVRAVDSTGAGDNFLAGFASELLRGESEAAALRFANACGAICVTKTGAGAALESRAQVLAFLENEKGGEG